MCSTCCALGLVRKYREQQFVVATGDLQNVWGTWWRTEYNIKMVMRKNEFGVYSSDLRWQLYKMGNFKLVLVHYVSRAWLILGAKNLNVNNYFAKVCIKGKCGDYTER